MREINDPAQRLQRDLSRGHRAIRVTDGGRDARAPLAQLS